MYYKLHNGLTLESSLCLSGCFETVLSDKITDARFLSKLINPFNEDISKEYSSVESQVTPETDSSTREDVFMRPFARHSKVASSDDINFPVKEKRSIFDIYVNLLKKIFFVDYFKKVFHHEKKS